MNLLLTECMWCITLFVYRIDDVKSDNVVFENAKFNGSLVRNSTFIMFRCELRQRPIGNSVLFQVNFTTVDVITFKNNKCYDKNKECKIEKCLCSNDEYKFQMEYWLERPKAAKSYNFGVEMLLHDNKSNIVTLTLWRCYDGKEFGKIQIGREISRNIVLYNTDENGNSLDNDADGTKIWICLLVSVVLILIVVLCIIYSRYHLLGLQRKGRYSQVIFTDLHEETSKATSNVAYKTTKTDATVDLSFSLEDSIATSDTVLERFSENQISSKESSVPARVKEYCISSATSNVAYKTTKTDVTVVDLSFSLEDSTATSDTVLERFSENQISSKESSVPARVNEYAISSDGFELKELKITEEKLSDLKDLEVNNDQLQNVDTLQYSTVGFMKNTLKKLNAKQIFLEKEVSSVLLHKANEAKFQKINYEDVSSAVNTLIQKMDLDQENKHIQREGFHIGIIDCPLSFSQFITINEKSSDQCHCTIVNIDRPIRSTTRWISNDAIEKDWYVTSIVCLDAKGDCGFHTTLEDTYVIITDIQEQKTEQFMQLLTFANNTKVMVPMYIGAARCNEGVLRNELKPFVSGRTMYNDQRKTNSLAVDDHIRSFFHSIKELRNRVSKSVFKLLFSLPSLTIAIYEGVKLDKNQIVSRSMQDAAEQKTNCISKMCVRINASLLPPLGESCKERSQYLKMVYKSSKYKTIQEKVWIRNRMIKARQIMTYLNERWRNILLIEHLDTCKPKWQALKSAQDQNDAAVTIDKLRYQLSEREYDFFGFEHICREMGQMNGAMMECNLLTLERSTKNYLELPHTNSKPLIELMDIIKTVLDKLRESIGVTKQLTISVLGIQGSGRSTFLNTSFSCFGFTESKERWKRAPELSREKDSHYNKHATFLIGVDDGTIINMEGENRLRGTCIYAFGKENDNDDTANIWYFGDLWNEILSYRKCVNGDQDALVSDWSMMIRETYPTMTDAILLILKDCVDFSFRNSLESKAYNNMERHCQGLTRTLEKNVLESIRSTLLNTKFSSEFVVITKRCTRAMLMQLVPVLYKTAAYDYVHVIDTRALRAPELSREKNSHYNKHATFVIGVEDGTIINMEGENILRGTDFLLIVFHAIPRLQLVNDRLNLKQKGVYVSPPYAIDKGIQQRKALVVLDKVKQEAAGDENIACIYAFGKEIDIYDEANIWYFGDLWNKNPGYSKYLYRVLYFELPMMKKATSFTMADTFSQIFKGDMVFSFRNSLDSKAYNIIERQCQDLSRTLEKYVPEFIMSFVKRNTPKNVIIQWTQSKKTTFKLLEEILVSRAKTDIKNTKEALKIQILNIREKIIREIKTYELATYQAANMQGKTQVRDKLEVKIDISWSSWLNQPPGLKDGIEIESIADQIENLLYEKLTSDAAFIIYVYLLRKLKGGTSPVITHTEHFSSLSNWMEFGKETSDNWRNTNVDRINKTFR